MFLSRELREKLIEFGYIDAERPPDWATAEAVAAAESDAERSATRVAEALRRIAAARASGSEPEPPSSPLILHEWEFLGSLRDAMRNHEIAKRDLCADARAVMYKLGMRDCNAFLAWLRAHDPAEEAAALLGVSVERIKAYWATPENDRPVYRCREGLPGTRHRGRVSRR